MKKSEHELNVPDDHSYAAAIERARNEALSASSLEPRKEARALATRARYEHG